MDATFDQFLTANLPEGALLQGPGSGSGEDERLQAAAAAAAREGNPTPLVKEELRQRILLKRSQAGQPVLKSESPRPRTYELTPEEREKKERRKQQNRIAARRHREKKKSLESGVWKKCRQTERVNQKLRSEVTQLQQYEAALKTWLLTHMVVCQLRLPDHTPPPGQPVLRQRQQIEQREEQQQPQTLLLPSSEQLPQDVEEFLKEQQAREQQQQQQRRSPEWHKRQPQEERNDPRSSPLAHRSSPSPQTVTTTPTMTTTEACGTESPMLGSQGFEAICSGLQSEDLFLDSQELAAALGCHAAPDSAPGDARCSQNEPSAAADQQRRDLPPQPQYLNPSPPPPPPAGFFPQPVQTPTSLPPSEMVGHLPSNALELIFPLPADTRPLQAITPPVVTSSDEGRGPEDATLDLPGFPFAMRRKRKSVDSARKGEGERAKMMIKSATYPRIVSPSSPADDPTATTISVFAPTTTTTATTTTNDNDKNNGLLPDPTTWVAFTLGVGTGGPWPPHGESTSPAPPSPHPYYHHHHGATPIPSPSPSPRSPGCFTFSALTPPPRSSLTPQPPPSPLTPPPPPPSYASPFPGGGAVSTGSPEAGGARLVPQAPMLGPPLLMPPVVGGQEGEQMDVEESLREHVALFLSSSPCEEDSECLSTHNIHDFLKDGLMSSQED